MEGRRRADRRAGSRADRSADHAEECYAFRPGQAAESPYPNKPAVWVSMIHETSRLDPDVLVADDTKRNQRGMKKGLDIYEYFGREDCFYRHSNPPEQAALLGREDIRQAFKDLPEGHYQG